MPQPGEIRPGPNGRRAQWTGERWVEIAPAPTAPATPGPRPVASGNIIQQQIGNRTYNTKAAGDLASDDIALQREARAFAIEGAKSKGRAKEIEALLNQTSTGPLAYIGHGVKALAGAPQDFTNLSTIKRLGGQGVFGDLDKLKGAISDKDVRFLREQQVDPGKFGNENQRIVNLMKWTGDRSRAYEAAMNAWANRLGAPSALNARGQSFQGWWAQWSEENMPRPDVVKANAKAQNQGGKFSLVSVEDVR
jgi:hypothetical protein